MAASGQTTAVIGWGAGAALRLRSRAKFASAAFGSHFVVWEIEGCTRRSQIPVSPIGDLTSRTVPKTPATRINSIAATAGAQRLPAEIGGLGDAPSRAGSEAARTVTKLSP